MPRGPEPVDRGREPLAYHARSKSDNLDHGSRRAHDEVRPRAARRYSSMSQNSFPSGSLNIAYVPQSSVVVGVVNSTPARLRARSSILTSFATKEIPEFPGSKGWRPSHRWNAMFSFFGATVIQWPW